MLKLNMSKLYLSVADSAYPQLEKISAMQRRRLSAIAKLALNSALSALEQHKVDYMIWVSQYGDEHKTFKILNDVLQDQPASPTQFSTSVHNAISGLYSILNQDDTPSTSLAGTWNDGLIEAYAWLKTTTISQAQVLLVYYDENLPMIYSDSQHVEPFALAGVISLTSENLMLNPIQFPSVEHYAQQANAFYHFWQNQQCVEDMGWSKI
ncbi:MULTISPECIES: beta-ketoacyl synthase chain length factor [unclassified Acinetobacter]|uniref:beta-ketoacyl synthase chain length factor n=1 Tax=unclassified Acinetobacter TaxID=196816 RepID=UPI00293507E9|nr:MULTISPECIES: beta-ketoacyl synthase chain length factor [unclassified Acinetobacter]WOE31247.1 beta-ketoacyl synthase chain length factor [Acinetobacter sp. SAAs470]WOE39443.1 beta-ketoacyl synthase chain length factor [Acinetobacter sp. SAAs474]